MRPARLPTLLTATSRPPSCVDDGGDELRRIRVVVAQVDDDGVRADRRPRDLVARVGERLAVLVGERDVAAGTGQPHRMARPIPIPAP